MQAIAKTWRRNRGIEWRSSLRGTGSVAKGIDQPLACLVEGQSAITGERAGTAMKTIGLLGGMSWESTVPYFQVVNREIGRRLGGLHSARVLLLSVDFQEIETLQHQGQWDALGEILAREARTLEAAGAEFLVLCTNTMHLVAPAIESAIRIPLLHIADATANRIRSAGLERVGLLGTRFTMEEPFYRGRLQDLHGLEVLTPPPGAREVVHRVIYTELVLGEIRDESRSQFRRIVEGLENEGAEGVILGCTEIGLLLKPGDTRLPLFDTALIHGEAAAEFALS
jgi:aspartate racemase